MSADSAHPRVGCRAAADTLAGAEDRGWSRAGVLDVVQPGQCSHGYPTRRAGEQSAVLRSYSNGQGLGLVGIRTIREAERGRPARRVTMEFGARWPPKLWPEALFGFGQSMPAATLSKHLCK